MERTTEQTYFQRGNEDGQQAYEKMLNINYQGNANQNQNHHGTSPHTFRMAMSKKTTNNKCW